MAAIGRPWSAPPEVIEFAVPYPAEEGAPLARGEGQHGARHVFAVPNADLAACGRFATSTQLLLEKLSELWIQDESRPDPPGLPASRPPGLPAARPQQVRSYLYLAECRVTWSQSDRIRTVF
jgi:hypothetical protein